MNPKSKKPRKQRKNWLNQPLHLKQKRLSIHASREIRKEFKKRSLPAKKGDTVRVLRGGLKGKTGKITQVEYATGRVFIEKIVRKKSGGKEVLIPFQASNLLLVELNREDEARFGKKPSKEKKPALKKTEEKQAKAEPQEDIWAEEAAHKGQKTAVKAEAKEKGEK